MLSLNSECEIIKKELNERIVSPYVFLIVYTQIIHAHC